MSFCTIAAIVFTWIMLWDIGLAIRENKEKGDDDKEV
jgi:hypothetical protein